MLAETDLAYIAGIIDGEGHIGLSMHLRGIKTLNVNGGSYSRRG